MLPLPVRMGIGTNGDGIRFRAELIFSKLLPDGSNPTPARGGETRAYVHMCI